MKDSLNPLFHLGHFLALALILSLPISALVIQDQMSKRNFLVVSRLGLMLKRMDHIAQAGTVLILISGIGEMWADGISVGDLFTSQKWLGIKLILFVIFLVNGALFAGPGIRRRVALLYQIADQGDPTPEQEVQLQKTASFMKYSGLPMMVLLILILIMAIWTPFTSNPP